MDLKAIKDNVIIGLLTVLVAIGGGALSVTINFLGQINSSIQELNSKLAVVINKQEISTDAIKDHESRIRELEKQSSAIKQDK